MYDVIVVGARCAGAPVAMLLARAGRRVLLLEKARFPQDKLSSHYIHQPGVALLARWGLLEQVKATNCPPLERVVHTAGTIRLDGCSLPADGQRAGYAPRRYALDPILAAGAEEAGAEFRQGCTVTDLVREGNRVVGVRYREGEGPEVTERARLVVGADGMRSTVARLANAPKIIENPRMTCTYYSYWEDLPADFELYEQPDRWIGVIPTNDERTLVMTYFPQAEFHRVRVNAQAAYLEAVRATVPELHQRLEAARQVEQLYGTGEQYNFFRQPHGPGWALVGDAVHHKDSITARGITDAFIQAQSLVDNIAKELDDIAALDSGLRRYAYEVDDKFVDFYRSTLNVAELRLPPDRLSLLQSIAGNQTFVDTYFATLSGACSIDDFYNEELLEALSRA